MSSRNTKLSLKRLLLSLGVMCGSLGVVGFHTMFSQPTAKASTYIAQQTYISRIRITNPTILKQYPVQGSDLNDRAKTKEFPKDTVFDLTTSPIPTAETLSAEHQGDTRLNNHLYIILKSPVDGQTAWYVYEPHVQQE